MAVIEQDSAPFQPYARLLTMLGDQLITDKKVAIIELIKNSYDADAKHVKIRFGNLSNIDYNDLPDDEKSYIEIEDDGLGMNLDTIKYVWLRPATPNKMDAKRQNIRSKLGRIIQGEKGIGRFAIHKLGNAIEMHTKAEDHFEVKLTMDFTEYDADQANLFNQNSRHKLLNEINNKWFVNDPAEVITGRSGSLIRIISLREKWTKKDIEELDRSIKRLIPPIDPSAKNIGITPVKDFDVELFIENKQYITNDNTTFEDVIERAQYRMSGHVDKDGVLNFEYKSTAPHREVAYKVDLFDTIQMANLNYKKLYGVEEVRKSERKPDCGPFYFSFYAFDLSKPDRTLLNQELKDFIKNNFVFVLRDGVRVYPYGEKGIDWLNLDKLRSTKKAGDFISYNDLTGFIYISQEGNPKLKDSTNRQGLMDINGSYRDFTNIVTAITEIFNIEIKLDKWKKDLQSKVDFAKSQSKLHGAYLQFNNALERINDQDCLYKANKFVDVYQKHLDIVEGRMKTIEDLAGLGMAVEKSSHDSLRLLSLMKQNVGDFIKKVEKDSYNRKELSSFLSELSDSIVMIYDDLQLIQPLFKIQRKVNKDISISECITKVVKYFRKDIEEGKINVTIDAQYDDFCVYTNFGLILQVLINLVDNAIYWASGTDNKEEKKLVFRLNKDNMTLIIADNGPGVRTEAAPLIFQEFFSMKSNGRGLGLYIVRELLMRINAEISIIENDSQKILPGANFLIRFDQKKQ